MAHPCLFLLKNKIHNSKRNKGSKSPYSCSLVLSLLTPIIPQLVVASQLRPGFLSASLDFRVSPFRQECLQRQECLLFRECLWLRECRWWRECLLRRECRWCPDFQDRLWISHSEEECHRNSEFRKEIKCLLLTTSFIYLTQIAESEGAMCWGGNHSWKVETMLASGPSSVSLNSSAISTVSSFSFRSRVSTKRITPTIAARTRAATTTITIISVVDDELDSSIITFSTIRIVPTSVQGQVTVSLIFSVIWTIYSFFFFLFNFLYPKLFYYSI